MLHSAAVTSPTPSPRPPSPVAEDPEEAWRRRMLYLAEQHQQTLRRMADDVRTVRVITVVYAFLVVLAAVGAVLVAVISTI